MLNRHYATSASVSLMLHRSRRPNGVGKSTVLHSLRGTLPLVAGVRHSNELLR
jgi:ABC-type hemin transport system ATPase subunit